MNFLTSNSSILIIAIPLLAAFLVPLISKASAQGRIIFVVVVTVCVGVLVAVLAKDVYANGIHLYTLGAALPDITLPRGYIFPVRIILEVDGISIFMGIVTAIISLVAVIYSLSFMKQETGQDKFYTLLLLMIVGMFGLVFTGDLFNLFVFLEILSISGAALAAFRTRFGDTVDPTVWTGQPGHLN